VFFVHPWRIHVVAAAAHAGPAGWAGELGFAGPPRRRRNVRPDPETRRRHDHRAAMTGRTAGRDGHVRGNPRTTRQMSATPPGDTRRFFVSHCMADAWAMSLRMSPRVTPDIRLSTSCCLMNVHSVQGRPAARARAAAPSVSSTSVLHAICEIPNSRPALIHRAHVSVSRILTPVQLLPRDRSPPRTEATRGDAPAAGPSARPD